MQTQQLNESTKISLLKTQQDQFKNAQKEAFAARQEKNRERARIQSQKLQKEYADSTALQITKQEQAKKNNKIYVPAEPHFFFVIRIRGMNRVPPKERKTLDLLRLRKPNAGVLLVNNESTKKMLHLVKNYVAYGFIGLDVLRELVMKRGLTKVDGKVVNITNENIEDFFGDLVCVEDLVASLWFNRRFKDVNRFLVPFRLNCPRGGFKGKKSRDFLMGGSCGNQHELIEDLVKRMID